ncbi:MAG: glycosyltransferase family 2 protein [Pseudomonadota bacterium]
MISVVVPTFNRPDGLTRAVESLFAQSLATSGFALIIVDNTPDATAAKVIESLRDACPESIRFVALHEPAAGVANARNCAMKAVETDLVAFLDDDQSAPTDWLQNLLQVHAEYPSAVTFGPVLTELTEETHRHRDYFKAFFARDPGFETGYIHTSFGCGNALIDFSIMPGGAPYFDTEMNETGGEDDVLFRRVRHGSNLFAWAANAPVSEHPPADRVTLRYTLKRSFSYGQAPITFARRDKPTRYGAIAAWVLVGTGKTIVHGALWVGLSIIRHRNRAFQLDKAVRGLGKMLWWIELRFYGATALKRKTSNRAHSSSPTLSTEAE